MSSSSAYTCSLSPESLKKAREELHEKPEDRLGAVDALRDWLQQQKHIRFPTDTRILLMFLRTAKFSQLRAREIIEGYCKSKQTVPTWYTNINTQDELFVKAIKMGNILPLGRNAAGQQVMLNRPGCFDPDYWKPPRKGTLMVSQLATMFYVLMDENVQVNGIVWLIDQTGLTMKHTSFHSLEEMKAMHKAWQNSFPARFKGFEVYNGGPAFDAIFGLIQSLLSQKFKNRMHIIGSNLENLYKIFPMELLPEEYLPDDYEGPVVGNISSLSEKLLRDLQQPEVRDFLAYISREEWGLDKTMAKSESQSSFRKLNVD